MKIVVIGAGIIGVCCAIELLRDGHEVTLLDPGPPGGPQAASFGNGGWISPASVVPMAMPGLWRKIPFYLTDPKGPLVIRWTALPRLLPWLTRFIWSGATVKQVEQTAAHLAALLHDAPQRHAALAAEAGVSELIRRTGLLYPYPNRAAFEAEALAWRLRRDNGITWTELNEHELHQREPTLSKHYRFAALVESGAYCTDPGAYVAALAAHAQSLGATLRSEPVMGFNITKGQLQAVLTPSGPLSCDRAILAAGIASAHLARLAGDKVSLTAERGYHVQLTAPSLTPRLPMMPRDGKMANTPMSTGLRAAGQVELTTPTAPPNWRRADILLAHLTKSYPGLESKNIARWMGNRPSTATGRPMIRQSRIKGLIYAFGHGHIGLASGPATGRMVAALAT